LTKEIGRSLDGTELLIDRAGTGTSHPCVVVAVQHPNPLFFQILRLWPDGYISKNIAKKTKPLRANQYFQLIFIT